MTSHWQFGVKKWKIGLNCLEPGLTWADRTMVQSAGNGFWHERRTRLLPTDMHDAIKWWLGLQTQILPTAAFLSSSGPTASFPRLFTVTSEHIRFYFLVFLFLHFLVVGSVR